MKIVISKVKGQYVQTIIKDRGTVTVENTQTGKSVTLNVQIVDDDAVAMDVIDE